MKRNIKKMALAAMLAGMLGGLTGCFIQPDPTLDPLQISDGTVPFGTVQALPTNTPTPVPQNTPTPTPDTWQSSDQSTWEDWSGGSLPTTTPKTAATVAPGAQSWQTSTQDYNISCLKAKSKCISRYVRARFINDSDHPKWNHSFSNTKTIRSDLFPQCCTNWIFQISNLSETFSHSGNSFFRQAKTVNQRCFHTVFLSFFNILFIFCHKIAFLIFQFFRYSSKSFIFLILGKMLNLCGN